MQHKQHIPFRVKLFAFPSVGLLSFNCENSSERQNPGTKSEDPSVIPCGPLLCACLMMIECSSELWL